MYTCMQVAFGLDFTERWNYKNLGLKRAKGDGTLLFLSSHALKAIDKIMRNPLFRVII